MPDIAEIEPHPTNVARTLAVGSAIVGTGLLVLALLVDCLVLLHVLLGILHLGVAASLFWWLWRNKPLLTKLRSALKEHG